MNPDKAHRWVMGAWLGMIAMVTIHQMTGPNHQSGEWPAPKAYVPSAALFTIYWLVASVADGARFAAVLAIGTDLAALFAPYFQPQAGATGSNVMGELAKWLAAISQSSAAQPAAPAAQPQQPAPATGPPGAPGGSSTLPTDSFAPGAPTSASQIPSGF